MGSKSTSHTTEAFFFRKHHDFGKKLGKGRRIGSEDLFFFFLENTVILGKNWGSGDLFFSDDFAFRN